MKRRSFLYLLILAITGCHKQSIDKDGAIKTEHVPKASLANPAGRVVIVVNSKAQVFDINQQGQAIMVAELPSGFHLTLPRAGYGPRLCSFTPSSEPEVDSLLQTVQLHPIGRLNKLPDRFLPPGFLAHLHLAEEDVVLASRPSSYDQSAQILLLDSKGQTSIFPAKFQGEVRLSASMSPYLALFTAERSAKGEPLGGKLYLYQLKNSRLELVTAVEIPGISKVASSVTYLSGLSFIAIENGMQLCLSLSSSKEQDAILIYSLADDSVYLKQKIIGITSPGALIAQKGLTAICQHKNGAIQTYLFSEGQWRAKDSLELRSGLNCPQSTNRSSIIFMRTYPDQVWCVSLDAQAKLSQPIPVVGLPANSPETDSNSAIIRQIID